MGRAARRPVRAAARRDGRRRSRPGRARIPQTVRFDPGTVLSGSFSSFGLDADRCEAVVIYDAALATRRRTRSAPAASKRGCRSPRSTRPAVAPALNQAANQVAGEVAAWMGRCVVLPRRGSSRPARTRPSTGPACPPSARARAFISAAALLVEAAPAAERRHQLGRGLRIELVDREDHVGEEAIAAARRRGGRRAGWPRRRRPASAAGWDWRG